MHQRLRHYWLVLYWAVFTWAVVQGGHNPGFVDPREPHPYPLGIVVGEIVVLAALTVWMARLLYRPSARRLVRRAESTAFVLILSFLAWPLLSTDLPGDTYGVAYFAFVSLIVYAVGALAGPRSAGQSPLSDRP